MPVPAAIVTTVKIKKINKGRYGLLVVAKIPKIAGGSGSVTSFSLKIDKKYTYKGKKVSVLRPNALTASCRPTRPPSSPTAPRPRTEFVRTCTGKG